MRTACPAHTPVGIFTAIYECDSIRRVLFPEEQAGADISQTDETLPFAAQIKEYFEGKRKFFSLAVFIPGTPFRHAVYNATINIPYGETAAYSDIALAAGYPNAMRAVGSAMKANQLPLLIPCHRVVRKNKPPGAYRASENIKQFLLDLEKRYK